MTSLGTPAKCGDLQAVALAGCAFVDRVQEDDAVLVFDGGEMDVGELGEFFGQSREFEIVRGEQGVAAVLFQQVARDGVGEGEAIEGGGAAPDLVHQHQAFFGGVVQDVGGLGHLDHEGGTSAGEVVRCADAREDLVDLAQHGGLRGDEAADMREQRDEGDLAHVGGFTAHVGAGDEQRAAGVVERGVVRR